MDKQNVTVMQRFWRAVKEFAAGVNAASALAHNKTPSEESVARVRQREFWEVEIGDRFATRDTCSH
ncbi:hypothetical protein [Williamsia muralis]|uniref:Uncharacterized protein n=1 Tax=Williamsia marianensis TaxID=85044 RepID=A0A2G3PNB2_WILMA|nr:hypothetical protein [Williamsia marianensis]PHV66572.1 hypothetical protein CSW57_09665 [Williamsia marianensis]